MLVTDLRRPICPDEPLDLRSSAATRTSGIASRQDYVGSIDSSC